MIKILDYKDKEKNLVKKTVLERHIVVQNRLILLCSIVKKQIN